MFSKIRNAALALAAVATLGTATLISTTDSAEARFGGGGFSRGGGGSVGMARMGGGRVIGGGRVSLGGRVGIGGRVHLGHRHLGNRIRIGIHRPHFRPNWCHRWHHHCRIHVRWPRPLIYAAPVVAASYAVAPVAAAAPRCTCLTKEYTQDGLVVFQDVCTKELASAPIGNTQTQLQPQQQVPGSTTQQ
jgi:hypothetical protein